MSFETVTPRHTYTPRALRSGVKRGGVSGDEKSRAFRSAKMISDQFIHQSASVLESNRVAPHYAKYCDKTREGRGLRKGG